MTDGNGGRGSDRKNGQSGQRSRHEGAPQRGRNGGTARNRRDAPRALTARSIAFDVILAVSTSDAYANLLLPVKLQRAALDSKDAALATELCYGTLRLQGYYDRVIESAANRPVSELDPAVLSVLRLTAHQLLSMRVPSHAAVNEAVELTAANASRSATGFVNAVCRTISRTEPDEWRRRIVAQAKSDTDKLAVEYSHPAWVIRAFGQALRADGVSADPGSLTGVDEQLRELLDADNQPPLVNLVRLPVLADDVPEFGEPNEFSPIGLSAGRGDPGDRAAVREGVVRVQDEGSQLAALALTAVAPAAEGERWLDLCAGPGGKSAVLAAEALGRGVTLVCNELVPARAGLVRQSLAPFATPPEVWEKDGRSIGDEFPESFQRILLDAPCTGLGALRRRPEARWRKSPSDVGDLSALQNDLFDSAVKALAPGGYLAYVTCSPHVGETRTVVAAALKRWKGEIEQIDTLPVLDAIAANPLPAPAEPSLSVQLWPHIHGTDAMFIALLKKAD